MSTTQDLFPIKMLASVEQSEKIYIIPPSRTRYLSEISEANRKYNKEVIEQADIAQRMYGLKLAMAEAFNAKDDALIKPLESLYKSLEEKLTKYRAIKMSFMYSKSATRN
jgi:isobutyryl-CoA mutase